MSTRLFVGNLPENINTNDIKDAFSHYGQILNVDLKSKPSAENDQKQFAFVTISASNYEVESCIRHFSTEQLCGNILYVTRARESFLERLQRERLETQKKDNEKDQHIELPKHNPVVNIGDKLNPRKRKLDTSNSNSNSKPLKITETYAVKTNTENYQYGPTNDKDQHKTTEKDKRQQESDKKRMESIKKKRQEFKAKQMIIKTGLFGTDTLKNKKVIFSDNEEDNNIKADHINVSSNKLEGKKKNNSLFDDDGSDHEVNFEIKKQFEGNKGQKVLDLQSRYKSDKRFILDERFMEDGESELGKDSEFDDKIDLGNADEKTKQLNILQDVLGIPIKTRGTHDNQKIKTKMGMLRFDPMQPDHAKFLAPVEDVKETKKIKKKNSKNKQEPQLEKVITEIKPSVEVSKEQFYKVSDTLKEALVQPAAFSLRSLFVNNDNNDKESVENHQEYITLEKPKDSKFKNPLDPTAKNPFVYDSSDSENEDNGAIESEKIPDKIEPIITWKESLFFSKSDTRLQDGLDFFNKDTSNEVPKERRELKSVMKKRMYNKERKNQMFHKKIGGRKKTMKKSYKKKG